MTATETKPVTYPGPSDEIMAMAREEVARRKQRNPGRPARPLRAAYRYLNEAAVEVRGLRVRMTHDTAFNILRMVESFGFYIPVCVEHDDVKRAEAAAEKTRKFKAHCERMGLDERGRERDVSTCDCSRCDHARGPGWMQYQPDASGYPTPVLFIRDECEISKAGAA